MIIKVLVLYLACTTLVHCSCIWYEKSNVTAKTNKFLNRAYSGQPKPLNDKTAISTLEELCPELVGQESTATCCSPDIISTLKQELKPAEAMLSRCPVCLKNFRALLCQFTCSPKQHEFMRAKVNPDGTVRSVEYNVSSAFAEGMFNSCKSVSFSSSLAIQTFCGTVSVEKCKAKDVLNFIGNNEHSPFVTNYQITDTCWLNGTQRLCPMNATTYRCDVGSPELKISPCTCTDCKSACSKTTVRPKQQVWTIFGIDGWYIVMFTVYIVFVVAFGTANIVFYAYKRNSKSATNSAYSMTSSTEMTAGMVSPSSRERFLSEPESEDGGACSERIGNKFDQQMEGAFAAWGLWVATRPIFVLLFGFLVCAVLCCGILFFNVTTDPVELWSSPDSLARQHKNYFDQHFGPFYRTEQVIIIAKDKTKFVKQEYLMDEITAGPALDLKFLRKVLELQLKLTNMPVWSPTMQRNITLSDICFKPLHPDFKTCAVQSPLGYFRSNLSELNKATDDWDMTSANWLSHMKSCVANPLAMNDGTDLGMSCFSEWGGPISPWVVFGGYNGTAYMNATAVVLTFLVENELKADSKQVSMAKEWEHEFLEVVRNFSKANKKEMDVRYSAERSIQDELKRESKSDVLTIVVSYLVMFVYVTLTLGQYKSCSSLFVNVKITLGLAGVLIVLAAVFCSMGVWSYLGFPATLIILEVVPFLVLAVGIDNIFILVQSHQRDMIPANSAEEKVARAVGKVGPSMLLSSLSESVAFFFGAFTSMPAVRVFALYAGMAVLIDFLLQITCFVAVMTLDAKRQEAGKFDVLCCFGRSASKFTNPDEEQQSEQRHTSKSESNGFLLKIFKRYIANLLFHPWVRPFVIIVFAGWACLCLSLAPKVPIGLEQDLSMPTGSYLIDYFEGLRNFLSVGPPVYFVITSGMNYSDPASQNLVCSSAGCPQNSMLGQIGKMSNTPEYSRIANTPSSWLDDYMDWLKAEKCCLQNQGNFCPSSNASSQCQSCSVEFHGRRPKPSDFYKYIDFFLKDNPNLHCAKGGHAAYKSAVALQKDGAGRTVGIKASHFMTYHTVLRNGDEFTEAYRMALRISENINRHLQEKAPHGQFKVFPYSIFYVFYEQYLTIVSDTIVNLLVCAAAVGLVTFVLLGFDVYSTFIILLTIALIVNSMLGFMYLWNISLNAVSLVNLVMTLGISVEFCSHLVRSFATSTQPTRLLRAQSSFVHMGSSVFSGITLTKLGGIAILGFAKSQLFRIFYFKMYLGIVLFGALHGLVFLPVLLSYADSA